MYKRLKNLSLYKIHLISWAIFITLEVIIVGIGSGTFGNLGDYVIHYILNIVLFYFCGLRLYPWAFGKGLNWIWRLPLGMSVIFLIYLLLSYLLDLQITLYTRWNDIDHLFLNYKFIARVLWRALQFMGFAGFYYLFEEYKRQEREKKKARAEFYEKSIANKNIENELNLAKNSYLQAQINPHLLFNTLNFIYQKALLKAPEVAESVMTLSDIMRYSTNSEFKESTVVLSKEIDQVKNLIKLHMIRFDDEHFFNFKYDKAVLTLKFIPLVIITLAENIFKHGKLNDRNNPPELSISFRDDILEITTHNLINKGKKMPGLNKGLKNIEQRLVYAYGENSAFKYDDDCNVFQLTIKVLIKN